MTISEPGFISPLRIAIVLIVAMAVTAAVYWPSLHGGFVFDDYPNILGNPSVHVTSLDWISLKNAALGSPSDILVRPLAMLSFGIDWYLGDGPDPTRMKLENLLIHLFNGLALFGLLRAVLRSSNLRRGEQIAAIVTAAWLVAPINFTGVAYVVQRMECLCQVFVLCGLWGYVAARQRMLRSGTGLLATVLSLIGGTGLGLLAKESAVLLPIYALAAEYCLFEFRRRDGKHDTRIIALYALLALPTVLGATMAVARFTAPSAYADRTFTLTERLMTEPRILLNYLGWTLLPQPRNLGLYHDDIALSRDLLSPWTTLPCAMALLAILTGACLVRKSHPIVALGCFWFLAAHLLTATFIPLELTFEHRNYFASIGVLLATLATLLPNSPNAPLRHARHFGCFALLCLFAFTTLSRSLEWGSPVTFAVAEAQKNPNSARAIYELGRTYVIASRYKTESPLIPLAYSTLEQAASMPRASILPDQGLLMLDSRLGRETSPAVWRRLQEKLAHRVLSAEDKWALYSLSECAIAETCSLPASEMVASFNAALGQSAPNVGILSIFANYALNVLHDMDLAIRLTRDAANIAQDNLVLRNNLIVLLLSNKQASEARRLLEETLETFPAAKRDPAYINLMHDLLENKPDGTDQP